MCFHFTYALWAIFTCIQAFLFTTNRIVMSFLFVGISIALIFFLKFVLGRIFKKDSKDRRGYKEQWFGKDPSPLTNDDVKIDTSVRPFKIHVADEVLADLKSRLANTRCEEPLEGVNFEYGFNSKYLREVVKYWKDEYNWRKQEEELNKYPHFKTRIEGLDIHFMHVKPVVPEDGQIRVIPLLIVHGWPGSFVEFYKIIPFLTTPRPEHDYVFEVICPSIPGYGFSESPHHKGFNARAAARIFLTLMERLGHRRFYVQGGDWGSAITSLMARYYAPRILGLHLNMYFFSLKWWDSLKFLLVAVFPFLVSEAEYKTIYPIKKTLKMIYQEGGYFHMQSTKPDTLGSGFADSPAGMAAYLLEKFAGATNMNSVHLPDGGLTEKFSLDELLTNVMMYWVNNNFTAAARFYKENLLDIFYKTHEKVPVTVPSAVAVFPNEVLMYPRMMMSQQMLNLVSYTTMPRGGHFAAMEEPELLADDIWKFVSIVERK